MARRRSRDEWRTLVGEWLACGERAEVFAARRRVNPTTLKWWRSRLGSEADRGPAAGALVEVITPPLAAKAVQDERSCLRLALGANVAMVFDELPPVAYLAELLCQVERDR